MKILIHDYPGHPFQVDLSRALAEKGYEIYHLYTSASGGPKGELSSERDSLRIINIGGKKVRKQNFVKRMFQERAYGNKLVRWLDEIQPDMVLSSNTPLDAQRKIIDWCRSSTVPFIFWLQDINSIAIESILSRKLGFFGDVVAYYYRNMEKNLLQKSDHIITIADEFNKVIARWGIDRNKITTVPNWAPIEDIPVVEQSNGFAEEHGLTDKFVVLYSGTMGMKHDPEVIFDAAEKLQYIKDIVFVVISEGKGKNYLKQRMQENPLPNLKLLPFQPFEDFPKVLGAADCMVTLLEPSAGVYSVPSKVWSGFCAQKASVLVVPQENLAARITDRIDAGINASNAADFDLDEAVMYLYNNPQRKREMAKNARVYAEENFYVEEICTRFEKIFEKVMGYN